MTTVETRVGHDWRIVAPWWRWPLLDGAPAPGPPEKRRAVRVGVPVLQKYDSPDLVNTFLADPQRCLVFVDDTDRVATVTYGGLGSLPEWKAGGPRKLYLASHHRHYLVVCSLHCDIAGFPHARRDDVCEAGFVVRARTADFPGGPGGEAATELRRWAMARQRREAIERRLRVATGPLRRASLQRRLAVLAPTEAGARERVRALAEQTGPIRTLYGWVPVGVDAEGRSGPMPACPGPGDRIPLAGIGKWVKVDEMPAELTEATFPLAPLVPDPTDHGHDGTGESIYFGVVPTSSSEVDTTGQARFDDGTQYEIRCFARRHRPECPRGGRHCTCPVTWSEPTEHYMLAGHTDLEGCANRPVTVQLPDLRQLHADALRLGPGGAGGVRFRSPPQSELSFTTNDLKAEKSPKAMKNGDFQICSFAIPLITIVAFFVLQLFLPIVVFIFHLWFLLMLRFCVPPDVEIDAGLAADFEALGAGLDIDAGVAATLVGRPTFLAKLAERFQGTRSGGGTLDTALRAPGPDRLDDPSFAAIGRGALAQRAGPAPASPFARRVERAQVVTP